MHLSVFLNNCMYFLCYFMLLKLNGKKCLLTQVFSFKEFLEAHAVLQIGLSRGSKF